MPDKVARRPHRAVEGPSLRLPAVGKGPDIGEVHRHQLADPRRQEARDHLGGVEVGQRLMILRHRHHLAINHKHATVAVDAVDPAQAAELISARRRTSPYMHQQHRQLLEPLHVLQVGADARPPPLAVLI